MSGWHIGDIFIYIIFNFRIVLIGCLNASIPSNASRLCVSYSREFKYRDQVVDCEMYNIYNTNSPYSHPYLIFIDIPPLPVMNFLPAVEKRMFWGLCSVGSKHGNLYQSPVQHAQRRMHTDQAYFLTTQAAQPLVCSLVLSRLDYCNSLLSDCPPNLLDKLQKVQNAAARLVCKAKKSGLIHPILETLHQLPVTHRIQHKMSTIFFNSMCFCSKLNESVRMMACVAASISIVKLEAVFMDGGRTLLDSEAPSEMVFGDWVYTVTTKRSETRMTASVVKQDPTRSKHIKGSKERCLLGQDKTCKFSG